MFDLILKLTADPLFSILVKTIFEWFYKSVSQYKTEKIAKKFDKSTFEPECRLLARLIWILLIILLIINITAAMLQHGYHIDVSIVISNTR